MLLELHDDSAPNTTDPMFAAGREFSLQWNNVALTIAIMGFVRAYKRIGLGGKSAQFAAIAPPDPHGEIRLSYLNAQPFGPMRAPANWDMVAQFVVFALKNGFLV